MGVVARAIGDSTLRHLEQMRCDGCRRLLFRIDPLALKPGKTIEIKCGKCDYMNYRIGVTT